MPLQMGGHLVDRKMRALRFRDEQPVFSVIARAPGSNAQLMHSGDSSEIRATQRQGQKAVAAVSLASLLERIQYSRHLVV